MGGRIDIAQRGWQEVIHDHDHDHMVTKVRCLDLPDSDRVTSVVGVPSTHLVSSGNGRHKWPLRGQQGQYPR